MFLSHCSACLRTAHSHGADLHSCWSNRQLGPGFPTSSVCGAETGDHKPLWIEGLLVLLRFSDTCSGSAWCGYPRMTREMPSHASSSGYGSWQCLGEGGSNSPTRSGCEGNAIGQLIADNAWGHIMPCSLLMFLLRIHFWDQALQSCLGTGPSQQLDTSWG